MKIFSSPIQCPNRSERRIKEIEAVTQLVARAFGPGAELRHTDEGRPYIDGRDDVYISISHCADICLLAVSDTPVGIDAETARDQLIGIAHKFLTQGEMARAPHSLTTLMRLWAAKEAVFKCASIPGLVISEIEISESMDYACARSRRFGIRFTDSTPHIAVAIATPIPDTL